MEQAYNLWWDGSITQVSKQIISTHCDQGCKRSRAHDQNQNPEPFFSGLIKEALFEEMMCKLSEEEEKGAFQLSRQSKAL